MASRLDREDVLSTLRALKPELAARYHVDSIALFGSCAHAEQLPSSDVDVLISFDQIPSLLTFIEIENYLADTIGVKVDLVMEEALKPDIGRRIHQELLRV